MKTFWKKIEKLFLVVHPSYLHKKQVLVKLLIENQQTYANLLLKWMLANYTPNRLFDVSTHDDWFSYIYASAKQNPLF